MSNQTNTVTSPPKARPEKALPPPITTERKITIDKLHISITSIFTGEQTISDKLFSIANRKLRGVALWINAIKMLLAVMVVPLYHLP